MPDCRSIRVVMHCISVLILTDSRIFAYDTLVELLSERYRSLLENTGSLRYSRTETDAVFYSYAFELDA